MVFKMLSMKSILTPALVGALGFSAGQAKADMMIKLESGTDMISATDGIAGDLEPASGAVLLTGPVGVFGINAHVGLDGSKLADSGVLHLNTVAVNTLGPGTLTVSLTITDLTNPLTDVESLFEIGGIAGGKVTISSYIDLDNDAFGTDTLISSFSMGSSGAFSATSDPEITVDDEYSATIIAVIEHDGLDTTSFDAEIGIPAPEPSSLALLGLSGLLVARRRRG